MEKEFGKRKEIIKIPRVMKEFLYYGVVGYFDGAVKDGLCSAKVVLLISSFHSYNFKLHCGTSSNMKVELLAL